MGQDPSQIREEIEDTRARMGDTVEALGYKADVPSRAKDRVEGLKAKVTGATPDAGDVKGSAKQSVSVAQGNPLGLALGAVGVGFLADLLIPSTRVEDEKLGPMADSVKERAPETAQVAVDHGKEAAQEAAQAAAQAAKEAGQQHAEAAKTEIQQ